MAVPLWLQLSFAFAVGSCVGSFLNVCIYRMPLDLSIVAPRSFCPGCRNTIAWYYNIPLLGFLLAKAKCSQCGVKISWRYPFVELLGAIIFTGIVWREPNWWAWPFEAYLLCALVVTTFVDLDHWIIPDKITLPGIVIGFISSFFVERLTWMNSLLGILFGGGSLLFVGWLYSLLAKKDGIGGGDIKYLAMAGAFLGLPATLMILILSSVVGSIFGLILLVLGRGHGKTAIPFGPFLAIATLIVFLFGDPLWQWYFSLQHGF